MDTVGGEELSYADCFAMMILIYLHLTVSVEMSRPRRSNEILFDVKWKKNEIIKDKMKLRLGRFFFRAEVIIEPRI